MAGTDLDVYRPEQWKVLIVSSTATTFAPLGRARRAEFMVRLAALVLESEDVLAGRTPKDRAREEPPGEPPVLLGRLCEACEGACCFRGETHAFLELDTIRRTMDSFGLPLRDVPDAYEARLPDVSAEESCVFHTAAGCALPREMRARLCNTFECRVLDGARRLLGNGSVPRAFLVRRGDDAIRSAAFVDEHGIRRFDRLLGEL